MAEKFLVHIENSAETYLCASDQDLLRGMEALGRRGIPVGCRGGGCVHDNHPHAAREVAVEDQPERHALEHAEGVEHAERHAG